MSSQTGQIALGQLGYISLDSTWVSTAKFDSRPHMKTIDIYE